MVSAGGYNYPLRNQADEGRCSLSKGKKKKKANKKDSQLVIRINSDERTAFVNLCEDLDTSAAREIRRFIRKFISENQTEES